MDLKDYIKELVQQELDEMSTTGGGEAYATPFAFAKKGQKTNAAIETAKSQGMKLAPVGMPSDSKIKDYKALWGKKKTYKMYENKNTETLAKLTKIALKKLNRESNYLYEKPFSEWDEYDISNAKSILSKFKSVKKESNNDYRKKENMKESLRDIIEKELLNEVTYSKFKNEVKFRTKSEQLHKAIREVKKKLAEIDRIVEYTSRMKQELSEGEDGIKYWKATQKNVATIAEMVNHLNNKIKNLQQ